MWNVFELEVNTVDRVYSREKGKYICYSSEHKIYFVEHRVLIYQRHNKHKYVSLTTVLELLTLYPTKVFHALRRTHHLRWSNCANKHVITNLKHLSISVIIYFHFLLFLFYSSNTFQKNLCRRGLHLYLSWQLAAG